MSPALARREEYLLKFNATGDLDSDVWEFLVGTGHKGILSLYRSGDLSLRVLAIEIRSNHRMELANLKRGNRPMWAERYQRWSPEQRAFYMHLLELEEGALSAILKESGSSSRTAA